MANLRLFTSKAVAFLITAAACALPALPAAAASTTFFNANQTVASSSVTTANNGWTSNNTYAVFNGVADSADYGFADLGIPAGATIDGIEVTIEGQRNCTGIGCQQTRNLNAALWKTSAYTASTTAVLSANDTTVTLGSATSTWGTTWTPADFADATFKVRIGVPAAALGDAALDSVQIKVYYTVPVVPPPTCAIDTVANLIVNPCLETADGAEPLGWSSSAYLDTATFSYPVPGAGAVGSQGAQVEVTAHVASGDAKWYFDAVPVSGNADYVYEESYKANTVTRVAMAEYNGSTWSFPEALNGVPATADAWGHISLELHTKPGTTMLSVYHIADSVGSLTVDDASLVAVAPLTVTDMVPNNSVEEESPANPDVPRGWIQAGYESPGSDITPVFTYVDGDGHSGTRSVKVEVSGFDSGEDADAKWMYAPQPVAIDDNQDYRFTAWYKTNTAPRVVAQFTMAGTTTPKFLGLPNPQPGTDPTSGGWSKYETEFSAPDGATDVTVFFFLRSNGYVQTDDYHIDDSYAYTGFDRALVTLTFDDGFEENTTRVLPKLEEFDLVSTQCFKTDTPNLSSGVLAFYNAGHEVCAHTITHPDLTTLSSAQMNNEITSSKSTLESIIGVPVTSFATPYGAYNSDVLAAIQNAGFTVHRTVDEGYNAKDTLNKYRLRVQNMKPTTTLAEFQGWVDKAREDKTWLIIVYHRIIENEVADPFDTYETDFNAQMAWLNGEADAGRVTVKTLKDAYTETQEGLQPPVITIDPYATAPTNQDVTVTATTSKGTLNTTSHVFTENGSFDFVATSGQTAATSTVTITNIDKTAPVITVDPTIVVAHIGDTYVDAGVTATDNASGDLTASIVVGGDVVSTTAAATFTLTYNVSDAVGNAAIQQTRTVQVTDGTEPAITLVGGDVTLNTGDTYVEQGYSANDQVDGDLTAQVVVGGLGTLNTNVAGVYVLTYDVDDAAHNHAVQKTRTITVLDDDASNVIVSYDITGITHGPVTATASADESGSFTNEGGATHVFTENGTFVFSFMDTAGNMTNTTAVVANIDQAAVFPTCDAGFHFDGTQCVADGPVSGCPAGTAFNETSGMCEMVPVPPVPPTVVLSCPSGSTLNGSDCIPDPVPPVAPTCSAGTYNPATDLCEDGVNPPIAPDCTVGTLNSATDMCETAPGTPFQATSTDTCAPGTTLDGGMCVADPIAPSAPDCGTGTTLSGGMCLPASVPASCIAGRHLEGALCVADAPVAASHGGGGGGSSYAVKINGGDSETDSANVTLTLKRGKSSVTKVWISNNARFTTGDWESYASTKSWTLSSGAGDKSVYVRFGDASEKVLSTKSDKIRLMDGKGLGGAPEATLPEVLGAATSSPAYVFQNDLWIGVSGVEVTELQKRLIAEGFLAIPAPTGYFGPLTQAAVKAYQAAHGIPSTGYVGPLTRGALNGA